MKNKDLSIKKLPPHSDEAERSVLGAILIKGDSIEKIISLIDHSDFYQSANRHIYCAMFGMYITKQHIDLITLSERLLSDGNLEIIGGTTYLMDLMEVTPTATTITCHAWIVKKKSDLRKLIAISTEINLESYEERVDPDDILAKADQLFTELREGNISREKVFTPLGELMPGILQKQEDIFNDICLDRAECIPTGFKALDEMIGGFRNSDMIIVAARPSMGKTSFALNSAVNIASGGDPVAIFSIETGKVPLAERLLFSDAKINSHDLRKGFMKEKDWPNFALSAVRLGTLPIHICDLPKIDVEELRIHTKMMIKNHGIKIVFLDYLQLLSSKKQRKNDTEYSEVTRYSKGIKAISREFKIPFVVVSQLSREVEKRKPPIPKLSDLRASGAIEQDADLVILLYRPGYYIKKKDEYGGKDLTAHVIIGKNRNGPTGSVKMVFRDEFTRFDELEMYGDF